MFIDQTFKNDFSKLIVEYVSKNNSTYMDAILKHCEDYNIEPQGAAKLLSKPIIEKLVEEGRDLHLLPKKAKLFFD
jgi:hypothetical protein